MNESPLIVALDVDKAEEAVRIAKRVEPYVAGFKVGLELLLGPGPGTISAVADLGKPVFADAKLADIPNTVSGAARQLGKLGARWVTVHAFGGVDMMRAAIEGLRDGAGNRSAGILAVTVLTSIDASTLAAIGVSGTPGRQVARLSSLAQEAGVEGIVCSPKEIGTVVQKAPELTIFTPGIRPESSEADDQARVGTPRDAIRRGARYLVVGRPITRAPDPGEAAATLLAGIAGNT